MTNIFKQKGEEYFDTYIDVHGFKFTPEYKLDFDTKQNITTVLTMRMKKCKSEKSEETCLKELATNYEKYVEKYRSYFSMEHLHVDKTELDKMMETRHAQFD